MIFDKPRLSVVAGSILHVQLGDEISLECSEKVHSLFEALNGMEGLVGVTPAYASLGATLDLKSATPSSAAKMVQKALAKLRKKKGSGTLVKVPVCYEGEFAPDMEKLVELSGLERGQIVTLHASKEYTCMMLGFAPGFVYLDEVDPKIRVERLETPRTKVPPGSIGIAGSQTGIYGLEAPGGWRLIGRTPLTMFNPAATPPTPIGPGDRVKFEPISADEFKFVRKASATPPPAPSGSPLLEVRQPGLFASIQDMGRFAFRHLGVPSSGGLDLLSQVQSNYVVGNPGEFPVIEVIGGYFKVRALAEAVTTVTGGESDITVNGKAAKAWEPLLLKEGDELAVGKAKGLLTYVAVAGRLSASSVMGSSSTYYRGGFGGFSGRTLKVGDVLGVEGLSERVVLREVPTSDRTVAGSEPIHVVRSPLLGSEATFRDSLFEGEYQVDEASDRTGYRLKTPNRLQGTSGRVLTYPTFPGYVQVPPDGSPIVLQRDCPTTGGYELAAVVLPSEMGRFSQLAPGSKVKFKEVDEKEASKDSMGFMKMLEKYSSPAEEL